jgi:hypothetical protein
MKLWPRFKKNRWPRYGIRTMYNLNLPVLSKCGQLWHVAELKGSQFHMLTVLLNQQHGLLVPYIKKSLHTFNVKVWGITSYSSIFIYDSLGPIWFKNKIRLIPEKRRTLPLHPPTFRDSALRLMYHASLQLLGSQSWVPYRNSVSYLLVSVCVLFQGGFSYAFDLMVSTIKKMLAKCEVWSVFQINDAVNSTPIMVQPTDITRKQYTKCRLCNASWGWASNARNI